MNIGGMYSFKHGREVVEARFASELQDINRTIAAIDAANHKTKISREKTMPGRRLYKPGSLNKAFAGEFTQSGWRTSRVRCDYPTEYYTAGYGLRRPIQGAFREMDFVKNQLGVEIQFGKYAFMVYNVCAKMTIFHNQGVIRAGVEIVPLKQLADEMSSGVSYFEQIVWDLEQRGVADIDIPVLILGVAA